MVGNCVFWRSAAGRGKGFTLIELLVVVAIIAVLVAMLIPALGTARDLSKKIGCAGNLRQIFFAMRMYADEHHGFLHPIRIYALPVFQNINFNNCWSDWPGWYKNYIYGPVGPDPHGHWDKYPVFWCPNFLSTAMGRGFDRSWVPTSYWLGDAAANFWKDECALGKSARLDDEKMVGRHIMREQDDFHERNTMRQLLYNDGFIAPWMYWQPFPPP